VLELRLIPALSEISECASGSLDPSHVLLAMGMTLGQALGSLRLTTGYATTDEEVTRAATIIRSIFSPLPFGEQSVSPILDAALREGLG